MEFIFSIVTSLAKYFILTCIKYVSICIFECNPIHSFIHTSIHPSICLFIHSLVINWVLMFQELAMKWTQEHSLRTESVPGEKRFWSGDSDTPSFPVNYHFSKVYICMASISKTYILGMGWAFNSWHSRRFKT